MNSGDGEVRVKQEGYSAKSRSQWSLSHKNPRIVRVSRNFGGKDRHSKVCTVRGLRDRRIRLSVPTAVQLYDLQEKLGLSQPSKVVDWLLDATKADIDELPPLPVIPGIFPNPNHDSHTSLSDFLASNHNSKMKNISDERDKWIHEQEGLAPFVAQNFFPLGNLNQSHHFPYFQWDTNNTNPDLSLSQFGPTYNPLPNQGEDHQSQSLNPAASNSHLYFCPNAPTIAPFPSYLPPSMDQNLGFSTALHLMSSPVRPFAFNVASKPAHTNHGGSNKED